MTTILIKFCVIILLPDTFHHNFYSCESSTSESKVHRKSEPRIFAARAMSQNRKGERKPGFINSQDGAKKSVALIQPLRYNLAQKSVKQ